MPRVTKKNKETTENITSEQMITDITTAIQTFESVGFVDYYDSYSRGYNTQGYGMLGNNYFTPDSINRALQNLNNNPKKPTKENILNALDNPKNSEQALRDYSTHFEVKSIFYKRLINFNADLLAWNIDFDTPNVSPQEMMSKEYKDDLAIVEDFLSRYNSKSENHAIVKQFIRQAVYYGVLRDEGTKYSFQELPPDRCKITGKSTVGYLYAHDFSYFFDNSGVDINMYPKVFKKIFKRLCNDVSSNYDPSGNIMKRKGSFMYWADLSPNDNFFCFTVDDIVATLVPFYSGLFPDFVLQDAMRGLEHDKALIASHKLLVGILDTYEKNKNNTVANQFTVNPTDIGKFLAEARKCLNENIGLSVMPVKSVQVVDFDVEATDRYSEYEETVANLSLASSASLMASEKLNAFESELALTIDANFAKSFYKQFENFLNYYVNKKTKKYRFDFTFHDINTNKDLTSRIDTFNSMAAVGLVDVQLYARTQDKNVFQAMRSLELAKVFGLEDKLIPLMSLNNQTGEEEGGRPSDDNSTNDNTIASKEAGSNDLKNT